MSGGKTMLRLPAIDPAGVAAADGDPTSFFPAAVGYPPERVRGRERRALGDALGLTQFGVNQVRLPPGTWSAMRHWHMHEDEFVYVLDGEVTLVTNAGRQVLRAGEAAGFPAGKADGHQLLNESSRDAIYLEVGRRAGSEMCVYSDVDLTHSYGPWGSAFRHRNGETY
jgi:uncharacterized cupin superfamily protein